MKTFALTVLFCLTSSAFLSGCGGGSSELKIGVVNLEKVLKESGAIGQYEQQVKAVSGQLRVELTNYEKGLNAEVEKKIAEFGSNPNDEQKAQLDQLKMARQNQLMQANQQASRYLDSMEQSMTMTFRQQIRPIVDELSKDEKYDLILEDSALVVAYSEAIDVSAQVAARLKLQELSGKAGDPANSAVIPMSSTGVSSTPTAIDPGLQSLLNPRTVPEESATSGSISSQTAPQTSPAEESSPRSVTTPETSVSEESPTTPTTSVE